MKFSVFLILAICLCVLHPGVAQSKKTLYYSKTWELTVQDSAFYYRICSLDTLRYNFNGDVTDYTAVDNALVMKGYYQMGVKNGLFTFFHSNGQVESEGYFKNNHRLGPWKYYFPDGKICREVTFTETDFQVISLYDSAGKQLISNGTGEWYYEYDWNNLPFSLIVKGQFIEGKKEGEWTCLTSTGILIYTETFSKNKFKKGVRYESGKEVSLLEEYPNKFLPPFKFDITERFIYRNSVKRIHYPFLRFLPLSKSELPIESKAVDSTEIYTLVEEPPTFKGGFDALSLYIGRNLTYPSEARRYGIQGSVFISFVVNRDGSISDVQVVKGIGGGCDEEAARVITSMPDWNPGVQGGKLVRCRFVIPVKFKLGR